MHPCSRARTRRHRVPRPSPVAASVRRVANCLPAAVEVEKCRVKLVRAVDLLCRAQLSALTACRAGAAAGGAAAQATACVRERTAFDVCTEDF